MRVPRATLPHAEIEQMALETAETPLIHVLLRIERGNCKDSTVAPLPLPLFADRIEWMTHSDDTGAESLPVLVIHRGEPSPGVWNKHWVGQKNVAKETCGDALRDEIVALAAPLLQRHDKIRTQTGQYALSFSLISADPASAVVDWAFDKAKQAYLDPFLARVGKIASFRVDAQVLHYAPLAMRPPQDVWDEDLREFVISANKMQQYVDPNTWRLDMLASNATRIHFVLFVPPADTPLRLAHAHGDVSLSNAFVVPQWGGVVVKNLDAGVADHVLASNTPARVMLDVAALQQPMSVFVEQIKQLLGVPVVQAPMTAEPALGGIADWQVDCVMRERMYENIASAKESLISLSRLVESLTTMKVLDHIRVLLERSIAALKKAKTALDAKQIQVAYEHSTAALVDAEKAFFDRDMLAMLYYPAEHNLAIYLSFFLPMSLPFVSSIWSECGRWRKRRSADQSA